MRWIRPFLFLLACLAQPLAAQTPALSLIDEAFRAAQEGMLSSAGSAIRQIGQRTAATSGPLAERVRERQDIEERLRAASLARWVASRTSPGSIA